MKYDTCENCFNLSKDIGIRCGGDYLRFYEELVEQRARRDVERKNNEWTTMFNRACIIEGLGTYDMFLSERQAAYGPHGTDEMKEEYRRKAVQLVQKHFRG